MTKHMVMISNSPYPDDVRVDRAAHTAAADGWDVTVVAQAGLQPPPAGIRTATVDGRRKPGSSASSIQSRDRGGPCAGSAYPNTAAGLSGGLHDRSVLRPAPSIRRTSCTPMIFQHSSLPPTWPMAAQQSWCTTLTNCGRGAGSRVGRLRCSAGAGLLWNAALALEPTPS